MKITTGAGGGEFSGSIGSITAVKSRYGTIFRNKVKPKDRATRRQQASRTIFSQLVNIWTETLTDKERIGWNTWASQVLINGKHLTGQLAFIRANQTRLELFGSFAQDSPTIFTNGNPVTSITSITDDDKGFIAVDPGGTTLRLRVECVGGFSEQAIITIHFGRPVSKGRSQFKGPWQLAAFAVADSGDFFWDFNSILDNLTSDNGKPLVGQYRSIRIAIIYLSGRVPSPYSILTDVIADSA